MMESKETHDQDVLVDLEKGNYLLIREHNNGTGVNLTPEQARTILNGSWNDLIALKDDYHMPCCSSLSQDCAAKNGEDRTSEWEMKVGLLDNSAGDKERKKRPKKPPRPPRPPITSPLDAADQKLINELSELAKLKRARVERMKVLKNMKTSNQHPQLATWLADEMKHWVFSRDGVSINFFHGPPISSVGTHGGLISIQFYKKNNTAVSPHSSSTAPNNTGMAMRLEIHGEARRVKE